MRLSPTQPPILIFTDDLAKANENYTALNNELESTLKDLGGM